MFENLPHLIDRLAVVLLIVLGAEMTQLGVYGLLTLPDQLLYQLRNFGRVGELVNSVGVPYATICCLLATVAFWLLRSKPVR